MDFIEFLQKGGSDAVRRVKFDGKTFKLENNTASDTYFELDGDNVRERGSGGYTGYKLSLWSNNIIGKTYYTVYKNGTVTDNKIDLDGGYAVLTHLDRRVTTNDNLKSINGEDNNYNEVAADSDSPFWVKILVYLVLGMLIACLPPLIFRKFILNAKRETNAGNSLFLFAVFMGLVVFGGQIVIQNMYADLSFLGGDAIAGFSGIAYCYLVCHVLNLPVYFFAKPISRIFKSERAITITFVIYLLIFISLEAVFIGMYLNSLFSTMGINGSGV